MWGGWKVGFVREKNFSLLMSGQEQCFCLVTKRRQCSADAERRRQPFNDVRKYSNLPPCQQCPGNYLALWPLDPHTIVWSSCACCCGSHKQNVFKVGISTYFNNVSAFVLSSSLVNFDLCGYSTVHYSW